jgi:hypothetical protein
VIWVITIDFDEDYIYWVERENGLIVRAYLDGTNRTELIEINGTQFSGLDITKNQTPPQAFFSNLENQNTSVKDNQMVIYPNPSKDLFFIDLTEDCQISIFNNLGQLVKTAKISAGDPVDVSNFKTGTYIVFIETKDSRGYAKLIIKND